MYIVMKMSGSTALATCRKTRMCITISSQRACDESNFKRHKFVQLLFKDEKGKNEKCQNSGVPTISFLKPELLCGLEVDSQRHHRFCIDGKVERVP